MPHPPHASYSLQYPARHAARREAAPGLQERALPGVARGGRGGDRRPGPADLGACAHGRHRLALGEHLGVRPDPHFKILAPRVLSDEHILHMRKLLKTPLEDLDLSVRAFNCLKAAKINSLSELVQYEQEDLMKFRNFGQKSLSEIEQVLNERGLGFGMDLSKLRLDDE